QSQGVLGWLTATLTYPLSLPGSLYRLMHGLPPESEFDSWVEETTHHLTIAAIGRSNVIEVAYEDRDPAWAATLVNELVAHQVERQVRLNEQASAQEFYEAQRKLLTGKVSDADAALHDFYEREGIDDTVTALPVLRDRVAQLATALADARTELAESSAE